jgi:hypothetical protein
MTAGWSALGGQTQSPYVRGGVLPGAKFISHSVRYAPILTEFEILN